jgi:hypothetical protein
VGRARYSRLLTTLRRRGGASWIEKNALLYDTFTTDDAAPITSPRTCEPGPGLLVVTDTENKASLSGGDLLITPVAAPAGYGDPGVWLADTGPAAVSVGAGYGAFFVVKTGIAGKFAHFGFDDGTSGAVKGPHFRLASNNLNVFNSPTDETPVSWTAGTTKTFLQVLRSDTHGSFFIDGGKLINPNNDSIPASSAYVAVSNFNATLTVSDLALLPLADYNSAWGGDWSEVTDTKTNPASGTTFDCETDFELKFSFTFETGKDVNIYTRNSVGGEFLQFQAKGSTGNARILSDAGLIADAGATFSDGVTYDCIVTCSGSSVVFNVDGAAEVSSSSAPHYGNTGGLLLHTLATNDIVLTTHPYPALGIADSRVVCPQDDDTFTHSDDCVVELKGIDLNAASDQRWRFRAESTSIQDCITLLWESDGGLELYEGASIKIDVAAGTVSADDDVVLVLDGANAEVFVNGTSAGSTSSLTTYLTGTDGEARTIDSGAGPDHIACFPRSVSSLLPKGTY